MNANHALDDTENTVGAKYANKNFALLVSRIQNMPDFSQLVETGNFSDLQKGLVESVTIKEKAWVSLITRYEQEIDRLKAENSSLMFDMENLKQNSFPTKNIRGQEQPFNTYWICKLVKKDGSICNHPNREFYLNATGTWTARTRCSQCQCKALPENRLAIDQATFLSLQRAPTTPSPRKGNTAFESQTSAESTPRLSRLATIPDDYPAVRLTQAPVGRRLRRGSEVPTHLASFDPSYFPDPHGSGDQIDLNMTNASGRMQFGIDASSSPSSFIQRVDQKQRRSFSGTRVTPFRISREPSDFTNKRKASEHSYSSGSELGLTRESPKKLQAEFGFNQQFNAAETNQPGPTRSDAPELDTNSLFEDPSHHNEENNQSAFETDLEAAVDAELLRKVFN